MLIEPSHALSATRQECVATHAEGGSEAVDVAESQLGASAHSVGDDLPRREAELGDVLVADSSNHFHELDVPSGPIVEARRTLFVGYRGGG